MNVDRNERESEKYGDLIAAAQKSLENEEVGTEAYKAKLKDLKDLQTMQSMTDRVVLDDKKVETSKDKWFDRIIKIAGVIAPFAVTGIMIWWDRREDGGHIMSQYINPALRSGDGAK